MNIDLGYNRRIRIEGGMNDLNGRRLHVTDIETGETIQNVIEVTIYLSAVRNRNMNTAKVTYGAFDSENKPIVIDGEIATGTITLENPEISLTAYEVQ